MKKRYLARLIILLENLHHFEKGFSHLAARVSNQIVECVTSDKISQSRLKTAAFLGRCQGAIFGSQNKSKLLRGVQRSEGQRVTPFYHPKAMSDSEKPEEEKPEEADEAIEKKVIGNCICISAKYPLLAFEV